MDGKQNMRKNMRDIPYFLPFIPLADSYCFMKILVIPARFLLPKLPVKLPA
jgi:hypothetical protein